MPIDCRHLVSAAEELLVQATTQCLQWMHQMTHIKFSFRAKAKAACAWQHIILHPATDMACATSREGTSTPLVHFKLQWQPTSPAQHAVDVQTIGGVPADVQTIGWMYSGWWIVDVQTIGVVPATQTAGVLDVGVCKERTYRRLVSPSSRLIRSKLEKHTQHASIGLACDE
jgi:hypothetical protein